jgi:7-keto-8-aminopelargonate synthetase-like enzyme
LLEDLETRIAAFEHFAAAMVFTTGYQANVGTLSALLRPQDVVFLDRLCHASIVDGCRLAGCPFHTFRHNDMAHLETLLKTSQGGPRGRLVVVEGVFSMDGDTAPLPRIVELAQRYEAKVFVDEAHATGVLGVGGRGSIEHHGVTGKVDIVLGTFSKSLSATGGFIAASREVVDYVRHYGRSYMFSASPTPAVAASVLAALDILEAEPQLRAQLWDNIHYLHRGLKDLGFRVFPDPPESAIVTIPVGLDTTVRAVSKRLYELGLFASTVAYPAVPRDEGRIRLSVSAAHSRGDLDCALGVLRTAGREFGLVT